MAKNETKPTEASVESYIASSASALSLARLRR